MPLGILDGVTWEQRAVRLAPNDVLLLYTDGITEAQNAQEAFFDEERLREVVRANLGVCPRIRSWRRKPPRNNLLTVIWTLSWSN